MQDMVLMAFCRSVHHLILNTKKKGWYLVFVQGIASVYVPNQKNQASDFWNTPTIT
jgi:hypothetical protein